MTQMNDEGSVWGREEPEWVLGPNDIPCGAEHKLRTDPVDIILCDLPAGHPINIRVRLSSTLVVPHMDHANRARKVGWNNAYVVKRPSEWSEIKGIRVVSPDGWHTGVEGYPGRKGVKKRISEREFDARAAVSTIEIRKTEETPVAELPMLKVHTHTEAISNLRKHAAEDHGWGTTSEMTSAEVSRIHHAEHGYNNLPYPPTKVEAPPHPATENESEAYRELVKLLDELVQSKDRTPPVISEIEAVIALAVQVRDQPMTLTLEKQMVTITELSEQCAQSVTREAELERLLTVERDRGDKLAAERGKLIERLSFVAGERNRYYGELLDVRHSLVEMRPQAAKLVEPMDAVWDFLDWLRVKDWHVATGWVTGPDTGFGLKAKLGSDTLIGLVEGWHWARHGQWAHAEGQKAMQAPEDKDEPTETEESTYA